MPTHLTKGMFTCSGWISLCEIYLKKLKKSPAYVGNTSVTETLLRLVLAGEICIVSLNPCSAGMALASGTLIAPIMSPSEFFLLFGVGLASG